MKETTKRTPKVTLEDLIPDASRREKVMEGLIGGQKLLGKDGLFTDLLQGMINAALEGELSSHLAEEKSLGKENRRNGGKTKTIRTASGPVEIRTPRDRAGSYKSVIVKPWDRELNTGLNDIILSLYARGQSINDIQHQLEELYGVKLSSGAISNITEQVWSTITAWRNRPLQGCYPIIYLDGIYFTVKDEGKFVKKVFYSVYGIDQDGNRDLLGLYLRGEESASGWGMILEDLKTRGVEEVFFFCVDGLSGFSEAIKTVYPNSLVQRCIVHMIRNSVRFVSDKHVKKVCSDLRKIYTAADLTAAEIALAAFKEKWNKTYPEIAKKWEANWDDLMSFMGFGKEIRRMIYTTNPVEALHRVIRKVTKTKGAWTNEKALFKQIYLTLTSNEKSWKRKAFGWKAVQRELKEKFGDRFLDYCD